MATATDPDSEGKTMAATSDICGACKTNTAEKVCEDCPVTLCATCARAHQNLKFTADHALLDIRKPDDSASSSKTASSIGQCPLHKQQQYTTLCKDCIQLACDLCKPNHTGHSLQSLNGDPKLCQRVCSKHIQHLLDDLHEIEELKSVLENNIKTYDEAVIVVDKWELELIQMVRDKTTTLRQKIKELKDRRIDQLSDTSPKPVASWEFNASNGGKDLSQFSENPVIMRNIKYGPGPDEEVNGAAILPTARDQSMIVKHPTSKLRFSKEMTYFIHVYIKESNTGSLFEYMESGMYLIVSPDHTSLVFKCKYTRLSATSVLLKTAGIE